MSPLAQLRADAATGGLTVLRALPRGEGRLLVALADRHGHEVAGQWHADTARSSHVARGTAALAPGSVSLLGDRVVVQRGGADRRLPALHRLVAAGGDLVAHRPERRGVVRGHDGSFTKVLPAARAVTVADTLAAAAPWPGVAVPRVLARGEGTVTLGALPGVTLHQLLGTPGADLGTAGHAVGAALARLHDLPPPDHLPRHGAAAELAVTERWLDQAADHTTLPDDLVTGLPARLHAVRRRVADHRPGRLAVLHRDLHDKQLLVDGDRVGLLDLDLLAAGDPALDLANLLVHLELRAHQGVLPAAAARSVAEAVLDGYDPSTAVRAGLPLHAALTRLRLAAVYALRPASAAAALRLLDDPLLDGLG